MLQNYIWCIPDSAIKINDKIIFDKQNEHIVFATATGPIYSCRADDKSGIRLAQGMLVSLGLANANEIGKVIGVNRSTVIRNVAIYEKKGHSGFVNKRSEHGPLKFTRSKQLIAKRMLDKGATIVAAAKEAGVSEGTVRLALKKGIIERRDDKPQKSEEPIKLKGPSERSCEDTKSNVGIAVKREAERFLASNGKLIEAKPEFTANEGIQYAGVLLALPFFSGLSYLETCKDVYGSLKNGFYGLQSVFLALAFMALLRIKNPEQLKKCKTGDLGIILGLDRCPEVKTIRQKLKELGLQNKSGDYMESLCRSWVDQEKDLLGFVYIDGHVRPYHGRKHTLPKTHVARRRLCMPATTDFWVNGTDCEPLFFVTAEANDSLLSTLDNEIIPELKKLSKNERVTLVFDREGWSPERFLKWKDSGVDVITYRKGKYDPWPIDCFEEVTSQVRGRNVTYKLGERSITINKKGWIREVRRLCDNGHQTSIISTRQDLSMEEIARRMFFRWNQENFFRYMREEFNLDHLVARNVEQADIERMVPNPEKKTMRAERDKLKRQLKKQMEEYGSKVADNNEGRCRTVRGFNISNFGLKTDIKLKEAELEKVEKQIKALPDKVMVKEVLDEGEIVRLETEKKRITDTIKMTCYRVETEMYRIIGENKMFSRSRDEGRAFMQKVFQQPADIVPNYNDEKLEIKFHTMSTKRENIALKKLCEVVNEEEFCYPDTNLKLVFQAA